MASNNMNLKNKNSLEKLKFFVNVVFKYCNSSIRLQFP